MKWVTCDQCKTTILQSFSGKQFGDPVGWYTPRTAPWPQLSLVEYDICSPECKIEFQKEHQGLYWARIEKRTVLQNDGSRQTVFLDDTARLRVVQRDERRLNMKADALADRKQAGLTGTAKVNLGALLGLVSKLTDRLDGIEQKLDSPTLSRAGTALAGRPDAQIVDGEMEVARRFGLATARGIENDVENGEEIYPNIEQQGTFE